jgi:uncharacterized protein YqgC (DUF456 family)
MYHWTLYALLLAVMFAGVCLTIVAVPGALWVMLAAALGYSLLTGFDYLVMWELLVLLGLCVAAEVIEFAAAAGGAKKAGGSKRAMAGAVVGGILGGIVLTIPLFLVGTILGVMIGSFCGAMAVEMLVRKDKDASHSARVGFTAAIGTLIGILTKMTIGLLVLGLTAWFAWPSARGAPAQLEAPATTATSTSPVP